jgi:hypothetical protein
MALPNTRYAFKEFILQSLGKGAIRVEVTDQQVENQIDWALAKFADYHFDGSIFSYFKYQITDQDKTNGYIEVPDNTLEVIDIFELSSMLLGNGIFNVTYQWVLANVPNWSNLDLTDYWMTMSNIALLQEVLVGRQPIRFNRYEGKLYIDMDWQRVSTGDYLIARIYQVLDPETYTKIWSDQWLIKYTTALVKKQWGNNLKKYEGVALTNGQTLNGQKIYDEAVEELEKLDEQLIDSYSIPIIGTFLA